MFKAGLYLALLPWQCQPNYQNKNEKNLNPANFGHPGMNIKNYGTIFLHRYLAQAKLTVDLLRSFKYAVSKGKYFNRTLGSVLPSKKLFKEPENLRSEEARL